MSAGINRILRTSDIVCGVVDAEDLVTIEAVIHNLNIVVFILGVTMFLTV